MGSQITEMLLIVVVILKVAIMVMIVIVVVIVEVPLSVNSHGLMVYAELILQPQTWNSEPQHRLLHNACDTVFRGFGY